MTLKELSQLYYLKKIIERLDERIERWRARAENTTVTLSDMPRNPSPKNSLEEIEVTIADLRATKKRREEEYQRTESEIEAAILLIGDPQIELILSLRFIDLKPWKDVADTVGGGNTEDSVKKRCYRFIKESNK